MKLNELIHKKGFTIDTFCKHAGVNRNTIFNLNNGTYTRIDTLMCIAEGLGMKTSKLISYLYEGVKC